MNAVLLTMRTAAIACVMFMSFANLDRHVIRGSCKKSGDQAAKTAILA
jgi:hypothetical protein